MALAQLDCPRSACPDGRNHQLGQLIRFIQFVLCVSLAVGVAGRAAASDYYVNAGGSDSAPGTLASPWRTLARVNQAPLSAGDRVYLAGGQSFTGTLAFDAADRGTGPFPIVVSSYGSRRATIAAGQSSGVAAYNMAGITISNIDIVGAGRTSNGSAGIEFYADLPGDVKLAGIRIENVGVSRFGKQGIVVGSWSGATGFPTSRSLAFSRMTTPLRVLRPTRQCQTCTRRVCRLFVGL